MVNGREDGCAGAPARWCVGHGCDASGGRSDPLDMRLAMRRKLKRQESERGLPFVRWPLGSLCGRSCTLLPPETARVAWNKLLMTSRSRGENGQLRG